MLAAFRSAVAARLTTRRVPRLSTLSPLMRLSGHSPNQEAKCDSVFHRLMSSPTSLSSVWATITSMPSMRVRSTPVIRCSSLLRSNCGSILGWLAFFVLGFSFGGCIERVSCETGEMLLQLLIALGDPSLVSVVHFHFLLQHEQQFGTPVALQAFGDLLLAGLNPRIAEFSQFLRIALTSHNRPHDRLSGQPAQIADHVCQLHVHLRQCLLHPLNASRRSLHVFPSLPPVGSKHPNLGRGLERVVQ